MSCIGEYAPFSMLGIALRRCKCALQDTMQGHRWRGRALGGSLNIAVQGCGGIDCDVG